MSQPNNQSDLSRLPLSIQQQILLQRQRAAAAAAAAATHNQNQNQNQIPFQYLQQNLAIQAQPKQINRVATQNTVAALQLMQQKQQQINAANVIQQQQEYLAKQNFLAKHNHLQALQAQQFLQQQQKLHQQNFAARQENVNQLLKNQNISVVLNELKKVTSELQLPNISEVQRQALLGKKKNLEEYIIKIRIMQQQQQQQQQNQNQKGKQPQLQINPTNVNQAQLIEQIKKQRLEKLQLLQKQKQQQQISNFYQQNLASTLKSNVISQPTLAQLTPQQQVQILSNMTNNSIINQTLLAKQQRLQNQQQIQNLGLFQKGQAEIPQQQSPTGILTANNLSNITLPTSIPNSSIIPTSTLASVTTNLPATSNLNISLTQTKVDSKTGTPTISTNTINPSTTKTLNNANITVNMNQINNLNSSTTPSFAPKATITNQPKQEKIITPTLSTKSSNSASNSTTNLNNLNNKTFTGTTMSLNSTVATATTKEISPVKKQAEVLKTQQQLSPLSKVKNETVMTPSTTINKDQTSKDSINNSYLTKSIVNVVPSPSLSAKVNTPKVNLPKSFSPLNKATTTASAFTSPVTNVKSVKTPPQTTDKIPANVSTKTIIDNKKTLPIIQSPALKNGSISSPIVNMANQKLINKSTTPISQSISLVNSLDIKSSINNNIKKEITNVNSKMSPINSVSSVVKPNVNGKISPQVKNDNIPIINEYFSPKVNPTQSNSSSSINNTNPSLVNKSPVIINSNTEVNINKGLSFNNNNDKNNTNNSNNIIINNNNLDIKNKNPMLINNNGLKVLESLKQHGAFTNIIHSKSPFQSTKVFTEVSSTNCITGTPLKISGKLLEKRKREEKFHDMVFNSNVSAKKRNIKQLINEISLNENLSGYTEQLLFDISDDLIDQMTIFASKMAKHRNSTKIEAKDVQISLERIWNMKLPGVDIQKFNTKKSNITNTFQQKVNYVRKDMRDRNLLKEMRMQEEQRKQKEMERIEKEKQSVSENITPNATPNATPNI